MRVTYEEAVLGRAVLDATGREIGKVAELFIDTESWMVDAVGVKVHREVADAIGLKHGLFKSGYVEIPREAIQSVGDAIVLRTDAISLVNGRRAA
jgi:sporulation protein YlmC with PRC-barrel domain